jgi:hypothetical protein
MTSANYEIAIVLERFDHVADRAPHWKAFRCARLNG